MDESLGADDGDMVIDTGDVFFTNTSQNSRRFRNVVAPSSSSLFPSWMSSSNAGSLHRRRSSSNICRCESPQPMTIWSTW